MILIINTEQVMANHSEYAPKNPNPDAALKGVQGGNCNRAACQMPKANWYNSGSYAYYCAPCAHRINDVCERDGMSNLCFHNPKNLENSC
jgi:hypothetical protein